MTATSDRYLSSTNVGRRDYERAGERLADQVSACWSGIEPFPQPAMLPHLLHTQLVKQVFARFQDTTRDLHIAAFNNIAHLVQADDLSANYGCQLLPEVLASLEEVDI